MHDLLQQMGWNIVHKESALKPKKRSRLWIPEDSYNVLSENNGTERLTGIVLDMSKLPKLELEPTAMMKMRKLRILKFYHSCGRILLCKGRLSFPKELRYLYWEGYPLRSLPTKLDLRYLVELDMRESHLEQLWEGKQDLVNLKVITLISSKNLVRIPDLSSATNLEKIDLCGCSNLRELPSSLQHLEKLTLLNFRYCENLRSLPSFYKATSLTELYLKCCSNLYSFPIIMDTMESLRHLSLSGTALKELPSSIENLIGLKQLRLKNCENLVCLPDSFYKLKSLERFDLKGCSRLEIFPEIMDIMEMLIELDLGGTGLKELPSSIDNLIDLNQLRLKNCENFVCLPDSFYKLKSLKRFNLKGCSILEIFPEVMDTMEMLRYLDLSGTALKELPSSFGNLIGLEQLRLKNCKKLVCLPDSFYKLKPLEIFSLKGCSRLEIFPEVMDTMEMLWDLDLSGTALKELPSSFGNLIGLGQLRLKNCKKLVCLPDSFYKLKSLKTFTVQGCSRLEIFPEVLDTMEMLRDLDLSGTALKELSSSFGNLIGLEKLILDHCENLVCLPYSFYKLESLRRLDICGFSNLVVKNLFTTVGGKPVKQKGLHGLSLLHILDLSESNLENLPTTIKQFSCLEVLILRKCKRLKSLPELPPSVEHLDAHDCTLLDDVSSIKKLFEQALFCQDIDADEGPSLMLVFTNCFKLGEKGVGNDIDVDDSTSVFCKYLGWLFTNCFQLDQNAASSPETPKLEMLFEQMVTILKDYHQTPPESKRRIKIVTCVPGSEIPEWFDFKSLGSSINIQLPSEWCSNNSRINFPCFVASVVVSFPDSYNGMEFDINCECHLKSCNGDNQDLSCSFSFWFETGCSDHLFVLYDDFEVWDFVKSEAPSKRFYNQASFSFYFCLDGRNQYKYKIKQCGVHLLFGN
ncbi:hypothetical protein PVK06_041374 [Gossypium arboreum]|uniref:Uncharacterized protein n=1 Tax=Gossypium arboreum TaxID=29729 RepID=A0ABR0N831_GOSAR|nr:hypothetical protein PVK06_041374 [Gossypium arboreum]